MTETPSAYVIVGAGKTAMDACLWLLDRGVDPSHIRWIRPRDQWLVNRLHFQPGKLLRGTVEGLALQMEAVAGAESMEHLFQRLSDSRLLLRIDENVTPTMYRCVTVTEAELTQLRRIKDVIRLGRVQHIERDEIILERGRVPSEPGCVYVDCSARGISRRPKLVVFEEGRITLQSVRICQPAFSAALLGHVEASYEDTALKNELCPAIPYPDRVSDWAEVTLAGMMAEHRRSMDRPLRKWIESSRLNVYRGMSRKEGMDEEMLRLVQRVRENAPRAVMNLQRLVAGESAVAA